MSSFYYSIGHVILRSGGMPPAACTMTQQGTPAAIFCERKKPGMRQKKISFSTTYIIIALGALLLFQYWLAPKVNNVSYTQFKNLVLENKITSVVISTNQLKGFETRQDEKKEPLFPEMIYRTPRVDDRNLVEFLEKNSVDIIAENENTFLKTILSWVLPALIFVGIWMFAIKRMSQAGPGMMTLGKHKAKIVAQTDLGIDFSSVAGQDEAKQELQEVIEFLKTPEKFTRLGAKIPKGILLVGPPGTGKTLMAKAVAGESGVPFFSISGSDFIEMFVGLGAARVRDLFDQAGKTAPCIVFIDELDALGKARGLGGISGGHDEREQTLNQLLSEMDGFETNKGVIILAATNRPEILDPALLRPGRFDRQILVDRPDLKERVAILKVHVKGVTLDDSVDLEVIARRTPGFTGADLANLVNEATLLAVRKGKDKVDTEEFDQAIDRIIAGLEKKNRVLNDREKKIVAYHETGHALVAAFTATAEKVHKITIVPRGIGSLGFTMQLPTEDRYLMSKTELLEKIDVLLGGRAAEELTFGEITTGAQNDLQKATNIARSMVTLYGMNDKLGHATYNEPGNQFLQQQQLFQQKEISDETAKLIDDEVRTILDERMAIVRNLLATKKELLEKVATSLLEKETLESEEFFELVDSAGRATKAEPAKEKGA
jgi:cell division protease FtsH